MTRAYSFTMETIQNIHKHVFIYEHDAQFPEQYIGCFSPHNFFPFVISFHDISQKKINCKVVAKELLDIPFFSQLFKHIKSIKSTKKEIFVELSRKNSVMIYTGGVREFFSSISDFFTNMTTTTAIVHISIKQRKGIFKLSCAHQVPIIPFYSIGYSKTIVGTPIIPFEKTWKQIRREYIQQIRAIHKKYAPISLILKIH